jgi:hypothetical protein
MARSEKVKKARREVGKELIPDNRGGDGERRPDGNRGHRRRRAAATAHGAKVTTGIHREKWKMKRRGEGQRLRREAKRKAGNRMRWVLVGFGAERKFCARIDRFAPLCTPAAVSFQG